MLKRRQLFYKIIYRSSMDIKPVRRSDIPPVRPPVQPVQPPMQPIASPIVPDIAMVPNVSQSDPSNDTKLPRKHRKWLIVLATILLVFFIAGATVWAVFNSQLSAVDSNNKDKKEVAIIEGSTPDVIASTLKQANVIKSEQAFLLYTRIQGVQNNLKAGTYRLSPSESTPDIADHLVRGSADDSFQITFYPGATLTDTVTAPDKRIDVTSVLERAGYKEVEIAAALSKQYTHPLLQDKPASADLEGYVFGETYEFTSGTSVEDILNRTFEEYYSHLQNNNLIDAFKQRNLTLYQAITLASIIQRESGGDDKAQIAQVFYTRLAMGMQLGSDVTYQYIADKTGIARDTNIDSPYNTRRYAGLPPGPIAVPGLAALKAVAAPAAGNYVYFLSGDDDVTYYAETLEQHEANIANHCAQKCQIL
jgi:UPF0755 protein